MTAASALAMLASGAQAQQAAPAGDADASAYLCSFAGKCDTTTEEATPTKAAPQTKGFRLAAAQSTPTVAAPATKGFRLATGGQASPTAAVNAPPTRSFRMARSLPASANAASTGAVRESRTARIGGGRRYAGTTRQAITPGVAVPRTDLLLTFELNSSQMTPAAESRARTFAQALMMDELRGRRFLIAGHTDAKGSRGANIDLSRKRAQAVADFLIAQGVDRTRVEVKGVGPDQPLPGQPVRSDANRRVEAVLLS